MKKDSKASGKWRLIGQFLKGSKRYFIAAILLQGISSLAEMITPQIIRGAIDNVLLGQESTFPAFVENAVAKMGGYPYFASHLWILSIAVMVVALIKVTADYLHRLNNTMGAETLSKTMRDSLFDHIEHLPYSWHMKNQTGDIIQRCTSDIRTMQRFIADQMTGIFRIMLLIIMSTYFMVTMQWRLAIVSFVFIPIVLLFSVRFHNSIEKNFMACDENEGILSAMAQENLTGVRVVRAFGREKYEDDRFRKHNDYYTSLWVNLGKIMARFWCSADIVGDLQIASVIIFGAVFSVKGYMTAGEYIAFISYNSMLIWPIRQLGRMISEMSKAGVSIDRVRYIMESEVEKDKETTVPVPEHGDIVFDHVSFAYEEGLADTLHDISFTVKEGTTVGILGGTGSGKSTLMLLLDRLYDVEEGKGKITIGGVDIRDMKASELRSRIGIVLQEPFLLSRSIRDNIAITDSNMSLEHVRDASRIACLDETVTGFSKGYDTFVGERGVTLSGGQKQRAAIARMLVQKAPIMILDDSLSAVDTETDAKIRKALLAHFGGATVFLISHRITTLSKADQVIVLDRGRISEIGTPEELQKGNGIYRRIYDIQSGLGEEE